MSRLIKDNENVSLTFCVKYNSQDLFLKTPKTFHFVPFEIPIECLSRKIATVFPI